VWAETLAFMMVPAAQKLFTGQFSNYAEDPFYIIFVESLFLGIYLSIPWLQRKLKKFYFLIALIIAILIPSLVVDYDITLRIVNHQPLDILRIWALLPFLMIPLVAASWQYEFRTVFVMFLGLGLLDGAYLIWLNGEVTMEIMMPLYAIFIRVVTLSLVGLMITELMNTQRQQRRALMKANIMLSQQTLVREQLATSHERNRLARELHDTLAHTLSGLTVQLEAMHTIYPDQQDQMHDLLTTALNTSRTGLEATRRALKALRAEPLDDLGLQFGLQDLVNRVRARAGMQVIVDLSDEVSFSTEDEEQTVYRITQESLENVIRHANAKMIWISLKNKNGRRILSIRDDGIGFDSEDQEQFMDRLGIQGMRERAEMIGAQFEIWSAPGQGTSVELRMRAL
jgi:signal transduction histidine kinase